MPAGVIADLGPALAGERADAARAGTLDGLRAALFGGPVALPGTHALRPGRAEGPLTGGTLSLLTALLGTPYAPPPAAGCIVFLEDVSEAPYRVDRMLVQLLQSGWLDGAAGIALGTWRDCGDPAELDAVFDARLRPLGVPVLRGVTAGHGPPQRTPELGAPAVLDTAALAAAPPHRAAPRPGPAATTPPDPAQNRAPDPAQNPASNGSTGTAADGAAALTLLAPGGARGAAATPVLNRGTTAPSTRCWCWWPRASATPAAPRPARSCCWRGPGGCRSACPTCASSRGWCRPATAPRASPTTAPRSSPRWRSRSISATSTSPSTCCAPASTQPRPTTACWRPGRSPPA